VCTGCTNNGGLPALVEGRDDRDDHETAARQALHAVRGFTPGTVLFAPMEQPASVVLSIALAAATVACTSQPAPSPGPTPSAVIGATGPAPVQPSRGEPVSSLSPGARVDGVWVGTITGNLEIERTTDLGTSHTTQDVEVDAYLTEESIPIVVDGVTVGASVTLDQLGSVVTASNVSIDRDVRCRGDGIVTLSSEQVGWIVQKWGDADVTAVVGFDVPSGPPWYFYILEAPDIPQHCTITGAGTFDPFLPPIGRWPMIAESDSWDIEMRALSPDRLAMTGSYQRHWVVEGGDVVDVLDLTAEWNLTWAAEAP
jgi:hypothetical protein